MDKIQSRFQLFLNEGVIKLPQKLLKDATDHFNYWALAHVLHHGLKKAGRDRDEQQFVLAAIKKAAFDAGVKMPTSTDIGKAGRNSTLVRRFQLGDLPASYLKSLTRVSGAEERDVKRLFGSIDIKFKIFFVPHSKTRIGPYWSADDQEIGVSTVHAHLSSKDFKNFSDYSPATISKRMHVALGDIEHELTHGIQELVLQFLHKEQSDPKGDSALHGKGETEYYLLATEFDPWIKTSVRRFRTVVQHHKAERNLTKQKELFQSYSQGDGSDFFAVLKKHDPERWKKAVRIAWSSYEDKYL